MWDINILTIYSKVVTPLYVVWGYLVLSEFSNDGGRGVSVHWGGIACIGKLSMCHVLTG